MKFRYKNSYLSYVIFYFGYYLAFAAYSAVLSVYLTSIGLPDREMSLILSAAGIFSFFVAPFTGYLNDRAKNPKAVTALLLVAIAALGLVFSLCRELLPLFLLNGVIMSFINSVTPVCERIAGDSCYRYGVLRVWGTFGYAAGAQGAGLAIELLPGPALFVLVAASCGMCLLGLAGVEMRSGLKSPKEEGEKPCLSALRESPQFFLFLGAAFLFSGCSGVNMNYCTVLLGTLGVPTGVVGTVLFFSTLVEIPLILFSNKFMDRISGKTLTALCFVLAIIQYTIYGVAPWAWAVVATMVMVKAVASTLYMMLSLKMVRSLVPAGLTTTGLSVVASVNNLAAIILQNVSGWLVSVSSIPTLYLCMAGLCVLGLALTGFLKVENGEKVFG